MELETIKSKLIKEAEYNGFYPSGDNSYTSLEPDNDIIIIIGDYGVTFNDLNGINAVIRTYDYIQKGYFLNENYEKEFFKEILNYFQGGC